MESIATRNPLALLRDIEQRSRRYAAPLPRQEEARKIWMGIGFRFAGLHLVAPLAEVLEILPPPAVSRVPMTKPWVKGIANVRGSLIPIMDLQGCLVGRPAVPGRRGRVLLVRHKQVFAGFLVDEVLGLKHFLEEEGTPDLPRVEEPVQPYLRRAFRQGGAHWGVFSLHRLAESPLLTQVGV